MHVNNEQIAGYIEGLLDEDEYRQVHDHLHDCADCRGAYLYATRFIATGAGEREFRRIPESVELAARGVPSRHHASPSFSRPRVPMWRLGLAAGAVAIVAAVTFLWQSMGFDPHSKSLRSITAAMINASQEQPVVLPGVVEDLGYSEVGGGAPEVVWDSEFDASIGRLAHEFKKGDLSKDEAKWLAGGYIAKGKQHDADVVISELERRYPDDSDLAVMQALLARSKDDLTGARELLNNVVEHDPDNAVAHYNLAVILSELHDSTGAAVHIQRVRRLSPGSELARKAEKLLQKPAGDSEIK